MKKITRVLIFILCSMIGISLADAQSNAVMDLNQQIEHSAEVVINENGKKLNSLNWNSPVFHNTQSIETLPTFANNCTVSTTSPDARPHCIKSKGDNICVQTLGPGSNPNIASRYVRGTHFSRFASAVKIEIELCYNENCDRKATRTGGDVQVVISTTTEGGGAYVFNLNCNRRKLNRTIKNANEILIDRGSGGYAECTNKYFDTSYARWRICEVSRPIGQMTR